MLKVYKEASMITLEINRKIFISLFPKEKTKIFNDSIIFAIITPFVGFVYAKI